jgi:hypothetical protein
MAAGESPSRIAGGVYVDGLCTKDTPESILLQRLDGQLVQQALEQLPGAFREVPL